jgi:hypothetical protein
MVTARPRLPARLGLSLSLFLLVSAAGAFGAADSVETVPRAAESVDTIQRSVTEWAKLRAETVRVQSEWQWQREALEASVTALRARAAKLTEERDALQAQITAESAQTATLVTANDRARGGLKQVEERLQRLTAQLVAVRPFVPPRLAEGLELAFKSIEDPKLGPAERMQHIVTIFNRCGAFNKSLTLAEQELALDGTGNTRLLEVLYVGLSHAYAYDRTNRAVYFGLPTQTGWTWEARPEAADEVARMIAIHREESDPVYVTVPAQVTEPFAGEEKR